MSFNIKYAINLKARKTDKIFPTNTKKFDILNRDIAVTKILIVMREKCLKDMGRNEKLANKYMQTFIPLLIK